MDGVYQLKSLFEKTFSESPNSIEELPKSGSDRFYYRIKGNSNTAIGVYNYNLRENNAFTYFSKLFKKIKLNVPEIYAYNPDEFIYLQTDLGDKTLFSLLKDITGLSKEVKNYYVESIKMLTKFQFETPEYIDFKYCYPYSSFDSQSIAWDLNYFKYYFAKLSGTYFDEFLLENDFKTLINYLISTQTNFFLYRDFQSRNIMIKDKKLYFIDFQGGRKGAFYYDIASLLYDAKANLSAEVRLELLEIYKKEISKYIKVSDVNFNSYFASYVLIRILQSLGAYGYRGYYQKKEHFLSSIPFALNNLNYLLDSNAFNFKTPELTRLLYSLINNDKLRQIKINNLTISINSFSYKEAIPIDNTNNGGGFVFDCRALPNPGRKAEFAYLNGKDEKVINYLNNSFEVVTFLQNTFNLIDLSINNYIERGFSHLMINFGCTGGQHRSVFCAEQLSKHIKSKYNIHPLVIHTQQSKWKNMIM